MAVLLPWLLKNCQGAMCWAHMPAYTHSLHTIPSAPSNFFLFWCTQQSLSETLTKKSTRKQLKNALCQALQCKCDWEPLWTSSPEHILEDKPCSILQTKPWTFLQTQKETNLIRG
jgi:hypothetical protein